MHTCTYFGHKMPVSYQQFYMNVKQKSPQVQEAEGTSVTFWANKLRTKNYSKGFPCYAWKNVLFIPN